jgi:hypothetical protein
LDQMFHRGIADIFQEPIEVWAEEDRDRLESQYDEALSPKLTTVRAMHRLLAQLRQYLPLLPNGEINSADYILLTFLRIHFPRLYSQLAINKELLLYGVRDPWRKLSQPERVEELSKRVRSLTSHVAAPEYELARSVLLSLFPALADGHRGGSLDGRATRRISDADYFDRYFIYGVPANDVSDLETDAAISGIGRLDSQAASWLRSIITGADVDRSARVLIKARVSSAEISGSALEAVLDFALDVFPEVSTQSLFMSSPTYRLRDWITDLASRTTRPPAELILLMEQQMGIEETLKAINRTRSVPRNPNKDIVGLLVAEAGKRAADNLIALLESRSWDQRRSMIQLYSAANAFVPGIGTESRIWTLIDGKVISLAELAAVWSIVGTDVQTGDTSIHGINESYFCIIANHRGLFKTDVSNSLGTEEINNQDTSWPNLVRYAEMALMSWSFRTTLTEEGGSAIGPSQSAVSKPGRHLT